jgi:hypothetical protein
MFKKCVVYLLTLILNPTFDFLETPENNTTLLTPQHEEARLNWVTHRNSRAALYGFGTNKVYVHIDEKCFYSFRLGVQLYFPPDVSPEPQQATSKTQIPFVMFLAAVAPPRYIF